MRPRSRTLFQDRTLLLAMTIPSQLGVAFNLRIVESFAKYVAPALGWESAG